MGNATNCSKPISDDLPVEAQDPFFLSNMWVQFLLVKIIYVDPMVHNYEPDAI